MDNKAKANNTITDEDDEQKMEFLSQFFDNEQIEKEDKAIAQAQLHAKKQKKKKVLLLRKKQRRNRRNKSKDIMSDIPDEPGLWLFSFLIFSLMGYLFDLQLIYLTPVLFVAFILYLITKSSIERKRIFKKVTQFEPLLQFKALFTSKKPQPKPNTKQIQPIYIDELEYPLLSI